MSETMEQEIVLPPLDGAYECQREYGMTQPTAGEYSIIESMARAQCRERQLLQALRELAEARKQYRACLDARMEALKLHMERVSMLEAERDEAYENGRRKGIEEWT